MRLSTKILILIVTILINPSWSVGSMAQTPNPELNSDLRGSSATFIIEQNGAHNLRYALVKDNQQGHALEKKSLDSEGNIISRRISNDTADSFDSKFVRIFVASKYENARDTKQKCSVTFKLSMRGDEHIVCSHEKKQIEIVDNFLKVIKDELVR